MCAQRPREPVARADAQLQAHLRPGRAHPERVCRDRSAQVGVLRQLQVDGQRDASRSAQGHQPQVREDQSAQRRKGPTGQPDLRNGNFQFLLDDKIFSRLTIII